MKRIALFIGFLLMGCSERSSDAPSPSAVGDVSGSNKGGSMARFAVKGDYLYTVDNQSLNIFNIRDNQNPTKVGDVKIGDDIETIFPFNDWLLIGSMRGMYIYELSNPERPERLGMYEHVIACDPVVAQDKYAYVTLRSEAANRFCNRGENALHVLDISNPANIRRIARYAMVQPGGLGVDGKYLFVCDQGLKVYDNTDPTNLILKKKYSIDGYDVIPLGNLLIAVATQGLYQYYYTPDTMYHISTIPFGKLF
ncbi:MAG: hypothetical protein NZM38_07990 [Cytophagales bacterium]|nr:hypothetical protein [Cytophagales bacterium]MDW8384698.1 hypothetical protein [Flammeovirgaceae bacterium]